MLRPAAAVIAAMQGPLAIPVRSQSAWWVPQKQVVVSPPMLHVPFVRTQAETAWHRLKPVGSVAARGQQPSVAGLPPRSRHVSHAAARDAAGAVSTHVGAPPIPPVPATPPPVPAV